MTRAEIQQLIKVLQNAYVCCHQCGDKYGVYSVGCSSMWKENVIFVVKLKLSLKPGTGLILLLACASLIYN